MLYDYVIKNYHSGEPIFEADIEIEGMSEQRKREQLERLVAYRRLSKFMNGIYYIPENLNLADERGISSDVVARTVYSQTGKENRIFRRTHAGQSDGTLHSDSG